MKYTALFTIAPLILALLVIAVPQRLGRDDISCIDKITETVTVTVGSEPSPSADKDNGPQVIGTTDPSAQTQTRTQTVTEVVTVTRTVGSSNGDNGPQTTAGLDPAPKTVTFFSTVTSISTFYGQSPQQTPSSSASGSTTDPDPDSTSSPAASAPLPSIVQPHYSNTTQTGPYSNSSRPVSDSTSSLPVISVTSFPPASSSTSSPTAASPTSSISSTSFLDTSSGYENSLYFTNWGIYVTDYQPQSLPASQITRVLYAFADIQSDGTVISSDSYADLQKHFPTDSWNDAGNNAYGCVKQLYLLKKQNRQLKVLLSIGGWTYSAKFAPVAADATARQKFASSAVKLVTDWGFDGVDIDWEYPADSAEAANFVSLLHAVRNTLDAWTTQNAPGYRFLMTVASPAGPTNYNNLDFPGMDPYVDSYNMMAYDYAGSWDMTSGHQANIYFDPKNTDATPFSTDQAVEAYIARGVTPSKIQMGIPLYGRSFDSTAGLGNPYSGVGSGSIQAGVWLYKDLPRPGATEIYDDAAKASYSYDKTSQELISYDNAHSAMKKGSYLMDKGLGGAMFWEASGDKNGIESLVATLASEMGTLNKQMNLLGYPTSQYDNIRNGMPES